MKKSFWFLLFILLFVSCVEAQVVEYNVGAMQNSIVRTIDGRSVLIYTQESPTSAYFVYRDEVAGTTLSFPFNAGEVHDMRIYNGKVFFCGESFGNGMVGTFSIQQVFFSGGSVFWHALSTLFGDFTHVESLDRLDLFMDSGRVCMAMVGSAWFDPLLHTPKNVLVSACFTGSNWIFYCDLTKPYFVKFTDIACLGDVIVAVGTDTNDVGCYVKTYRPQIDFPGNAWIPGYGYEIPYGNPQGKVIVAKYADNTAAIAHFDSSRATVLHRVNFSSTGNIPSGNAETWITNAPSFSGTGEMIDLATSTDANTYLLQRADYPTGGMVPWLVKFDYSLAPASVVEAAAGNYKFQSLDMDSYGLYPRTSCYSGQLATYVPITDMTTPRCKLPTSLPVLYSLVGVIKPYMYEGVWRMTGSGTAFVPTVSRLTVQNICQ